MVTETQMKKIVRDLSSRDARFARVIAAHPLCTLGRNPKPVTHFDALVESVISQQLAVKAADTIYGRVKALAGGRMVPGRIAAITEADMRAAGVSGAKFKTIQGLADAALSKRININKLHEIEDDQLIFNQLTSLWGIGPWTVDMFMMHQLSRLDIWPTGDLGYLGSIPEMGIAFAGFAQRRWGWSVDPLQVRIAADVGVGVVEVLRVITKPGDKFLINSPVYPNFFTWCNETHLELVDVQLSQSDVAVNGSNWILDWDGIEKAYASGIKAHLICNPHNPLGRIYTREELSRLAELAKKYGVYILSDEIHAPLMYSEQTFTPFLTISDTAREVGITITAASKGWNIAGLKCAIIVTQNEKVYETLNAIAPATHYRASLLGAFATVTAFEKGEPWLDELMTQLDRNRNLVAELIAAKTPGVGYRIPHCSYLAWLDLTSFNLGDDPSAVLIEKAKVAFVPGVRFGAQSAQFVRLNFATSPEILEEAFNRLATVLR